MRTGSTADPVPAVVAVAVAVAEVDPARVTLAAASAASLLEKKKEKYSTVRKFIKMMMKKTSTKIENIKKKRTVVEVNYKKIL